MDLVRELKKAGLNESDGYTICDWCTWKSPQRLKKQTSRTENQRKNLDHPDYSIVEISQDPEKSLGEPRRVAVTQTPIKACQVTQV